MQTLVIPAPGMQIARLGTTPHRLLFFIGAGNLLLAMLWWTCTLVAQRWPQLQALLPKPALFPGWLHAYVMQYQVLPSFVFGFLLTVFPRWLGLPELARWRYAPIGLGLLGGQLCTLAAALGWEAGLITGWLLNMAGWIAGLATLGRLLWLAPEQVGHALFAYAALVIGAVGLAAIGAFLLGAAPIWMFAGIKFGSFGLLLPLYLTVAHRMFPFFAQNVVIGYQAWRPLWVLGLAWALCLLHLGLELRHAYGWLWLADVPLAMLTAALCWRWWPRGEKPVLLSVLFLGLLWLPISLALYAVQSLLYQFDGAFVLGRAPAHALFIGFFGSVLIAMVTRVTQGHSGRPLVLPPVAAFAFVCIQLVSVTRIVAELVADALLWQVIAAAGWLLALTPWVVRLGWIYLSPRIDGKPG